MSASVLYVAPIGEIGGVERFLDAVLPHHEPERVRPVLLALADGAFPRAMRQRGIATHVVRARTRHPIATTRGVLRVLRDERIDLVHSAFSWAHAMTAPAAKLLGVPQVWFHHGPIWPGYRRDWAALVPARAVFTNSAFNMGRLRGYPHVAREHFVQHLSVDPDQLAPDRAAGADFRRRFDIPPDAPTVGVVGFLDDTKGQDLLLEAARRLPALEGPAPVFVIAGAPRAGAAGRRGEALLRELHAMADAPPLRGRVRFTGHVDVRAGVYDALDVVVQPSTQPEAFGMVVLEAMAKGRATIATEEGGPPEFVRDGEDALLVPPRDAGALAAAIAALLADPSRREALGRAARAAVIERHHPREVARSLERVYAQLLRPARVSRPVAVTGRA